MGKKKDYPDRHIEDEISYKIKTLDTTRQNRITLSKRLSRYSRRWRFIFFIINIEAVVFVLLSLTGSVQSIPLAGKNIPFDLVSGIFTIYVILLQYYVSVLNYNERSLQVHYHQLEIEDLILQLKMLFVKQNSDSENFTETDLIERHDQIIEKYQLALKNNENHRVIDHRKNKYEEKLKKYEDAQERLELKRINKQNEQSSRENEHLANDSDPTVNENLNDKLPDELVKKPNRIDKYDTSLDNFLILSNSLLTL